MRRSRPLAMLAPFVALALAAPVAAQTTAPLPSRAVPLSLDSGWVENHGTTRGVVFSATVQEPGAPWLRLWFDLAELGAALPGGEPTALLITSLADGAVQIHDAETLRQWQHSTAYFNGDAVQVVIVADPGSGRSRLAMSSLSAGSAGEGGVATICGPADDRLPSSDPRAGRLMPVGCTAWIIDDANRCLLTAGHCGTSAGSVVQFNVPTSLPDGTVVNPPPEDQYVVDPVSVQSVNGGQGNDWKYFGCFPNTNTGLTAAEAQGDFYVLAASAPPTFGQSTRITGYGVDSSPSAWNQIQQTHAGPYAGVAGTTLSYETDTQGGNSGSAVLDEATGLAIGIHTHGGCDSTGGANHGTAIENGGLQNALANPQGVCIPNPPLSFQYPGGLPELLDPDGAVITVEVLGSEDGQPQPGSGQFGYDIGGGIVTAPMTEVAPNVYEAAFPPIDCGTTVAYYFSAQTEGGETVPDPLNAPQGTYGAAAGDGFDFSFDDDFENDFGWIVTNSVGLTTGTWERGIPAGFGDRGDPPSDADGSSRCYVTGLADDDNDIDGGSTTLASPRMDATSGDAHITYYRWYHNTFGGVPAADVFVVEVSPDDGMSWTELEVVGPDGPDVSGGWVFRSFRVSEVITATDTFRIRFTASDLGEGSVVEAAVDGVRMNRSAGGLVCDSACPADIDGSGAVDVDDLTQIILQWGQPGTADINGDGTVDVDDLTEVILGWGGCG